MADGLTILAEALSARQEVPSTRIGKVQAVQKSGSTWTADVLVEGSTTTRRMRWLGNGGQPQVGQIITYIDQSPIPVILGRVASDNEAQNFGNGAVSGGTISDGQGNLRTGINVVGTAASAAQTTANSGVSQAVSAASSASSAQIAANSAQNTANQALSLANTANNAAANALNVGNAARNRAEQVNAYAFSIEQSLINLYGQVEALRQYAVSLEQTLIRFLGGGGPDD